VILPSVHANRAILSLDLPMSKAGVEPMLNTFVSGSLISQEVQYSTVKRIRASVGNEVVAIEYDQLGIRDMAGYKPGMFIFDHVFSPGDDQRLCLNHQ
jgi:hypothetical protein